MVHCQDFLSTLTSRISRLKQKKYTLNTTKSFQFYLVAFLRHTNSILATTASHVLYGFFMQINIKILAFKSISDTQEIFVNLSICLFSFQILLIDVQPKLQSRTGTVQGQNRVFPVQFFHTGKNLFSLQGNPVLIAGTLFSLQGFLCEKNYTGKTLSSLKGWVCSTLRPGFKA